MSSLTVLYGQTGDTLTAYNNQELGRIATRVVRAAECDTLLEICEQQQAQAEIALSAKQRECDAKDSTIAAVKEINLLKEDIILGKDDEIIQLRDALKQNNNKTKWVKIGWAATTVVLSAIILTSNR